MFFLSISTVGVKWWFFEAWNEKGRNTQEKCQYCNENTLMCSTVSDFENPKALQCIIKLVSVSVPS